MRKISKCCIQGCRESSRNIIDELSFHRIPKDEAKRTQWTNIIRKNTNQPNVFAVEAMVCSKHFPKTSFIDRVNGSRFLKKNAIPSIFPHPQHESLKTVWSDNDDDSHYDPLNEMAITSPPRTLAPPPLRSLLVDEKNITQLETVNNVQTKINTRKKVDCDNNIEVIKTVVYNDYSKNCRFCLISPKAIQISSLPSEEIAKMYEYLTGVEYNYNPHHAPDIICTTCSYKLKSAAEFREYLIETNNRWENMISEQHEYSIKVLEEHNSSTISIPQSKSEVVFIEDINEYQTETSLLQPKLEVILVDDTNQNHPAVDEYLDEGFLKDEKESKRLNDDDNESELESDEDEKFIKTVQEFIKTVKPVKSSQPVKTRTNKYPKMKNTLPDTERLNFRSTSSPHSSQKLKKDKNWWRLMHDCSYCDAKDFLTVTDLNKHLKSEHPERIKVTCDICKKDYSELIYLRKHMKYVHQTKSNKCEQCEKCFYYNYNLKSHMLLHTNEQKSVICHLCGKFFTPTALHSHLRSGAHCGQDVVKNRIYSKNQRYYCHICIPAQRFDLCSDLTEHRRLMHKDFECGICKGWFSCMEALENHSKTHSNKERKFSCTLCSSTFVRSSHLEGHMRRKHSTTPKPISCDLCDYRCVEPYELTGHKKHAHSKIRMYKCMHCEKSFTHAQAHKDHLLTSHNIGEYRYSCAYCPKRFTNSAGLIHHRGVHHNGAGN